ncbi:restriction endonuclease subunit S [Shinella sp.]|uniref:restriction endonuclease subunit S n=1 Tax=Shinella sp. TaxID=1870904 RepID=UPI0028AA6BA9|nr:restriction endonuclease subunit S [Shinella sp.]
MRVAADASGSVDQPWTLPESWTWVALRDVGSWTSGGTPKSTEPGYYNGPISWFRITDLNEGRLRRSEKSLTIRGLQASSAKLIEAPFLMFAMYGASIGKMAISEIDASTNQAIACCSPSEAANIDFLFLALQRSKKSIVALGQGGAQPNISQRILLDCRIPLPPLSEQRRIVERIESLFAEIAEGEAALEDARKGLETFCRALLKAAATGELTRDWRENNQPKETGHDLLARIKAERDATPKSGRGKRAAASAPLDTSDLSELPEGWAWARISDVGVVQLGRQRSPQHHQGENMHRYLRVANVFEDRIELGDVKEMNFTPPELKTFELRRNDILLNEGQTPDLLGRPAMWRSDERGMCFQNTLLRFRATEPMEPEFCFLVFRHYLHAKRFKQESQITTNIAHLSSGRFSVIEFPVPPIDEQREIVRRALTALDSTVDTKLVFEQQKADATRLRQAILKSAFEGTLVPQEPTDEPASSFLSRLKAQESANPKQMKRRKKV